MGKFGSIVRSGLGLLKISPAKVVLYLLLSFVTQILIPVGFMPTLLKKMTDIIAHSDRPAVMQQAPSNQPAPSATPDNANAGAPRAPAQNANAANRQGMVTTYLEWLFLIFAILPLTIWFRMAQNDLDCAMEFEMRNRIFANVLRQPPEFFRANQPGRLSVIVTNMVTQAQQAFRSLALEPVMQLLALVITTSLIVIELQKLSGAVVWLTIAVIVLMGFFTVYIVQKRASDAVSSCQQELQQGMLEVAGLTTATMSGPENIQTMNAESQFIDRYSGAVASLFDKRRRQIKVIAVVNSMLGLPTQLILGCLYGCIVYAVTRGMPGATPGLIIQLSALVPQLMEPFKTFAALGITADSSWPAVEMVTRFTNQQSRVSDLPGAVDVERVEPTVEARNVTFQYEPTGRKIFDDVSFTAPQGKITGLVARFGQGKTTFFRLAVRLYDPQAGEILIGGHPTTSLKLASLRRQISVMSQNPIFFPLSVRDNLRIGKPDATDEEIRKIAEKTGLWSALVEALGPNPLDKQLAGAEQLLSGGQKRKFFLTGALLRDSEVLFFDEPTTGLDASEYEELIATIRAACAGKTVMVIDHIIPAFIAQLCDHVLVLDMGKIVQQGSPEQLMAEGGIFRELYEASLPHAQGAAAAGGQPQGAASGAKAASAGAPMAAGSAPPAMAL